MSVVHTKYLKYHFRATTFSGAFFFSFATWAFNLVVPIIILYRGNGLWMKSSSFFEQPQVHFMHSLVMMVDRIHPSPSKILFSTEMGLLENIPSTNYRVPTISNIEFDDDRDGKLDRLLLNLTLPLQSTEEISGVSLILMFAYKLSETVSFVAESPFFIEYKATSAGSGLNIVGDLKLYQKKLLLTQQTSKEESILKNLFSKVANFNDFIARIHDRPFTLSSSPDTHFSWTLGRDVTSDSFKIRLTISYPSQEFFFRPGFWHNINWFVIQVFPIFFLVYLACQKVRQVIFEEKIISTTSIKE